MPLASQALQAGCPRPAFYQSRQPPLARRRSPLARLNQLRGAALANSSSSPSASTSAAAPPSTSSPSTSSPSPSPSWSSSWPEWRPTPTPSERRPVVALLDCRDLGPVPYETAWELQKRLVDALLAGRQRGAEGGDASSPSSSNPSRRPVGALILLQHEPVYTLGAGATTENLLFDPGKAFHEGEGEGEGRGGRGESERGASSPSSSSSSSTSLLPPPPAPLHRVERGGEVTWHGPGQLVLYPILDLRAGEGGGGEAELDSKPKPFLPDLHWYLRALEEVVVSALARLPSHPLLLRELGGSEAERAERGDPPLLLGEREPGLTGVWVGGAKAAALGVRAARWATYHGLALNVNPDLSYFDHIVPCGIAGREVASVVTAWEKEARSKGGGEGRGLPFRLPASWRERPGQGPLVAAAGDALLAAFCDVLGVLLESVGEVPRELLLPRAASEGKGQEGREKTTMVSFAESVVRGGKN